MKKTLIQLKRNARVSRTWRLRRKRSTRTRTTTGWGRTSLDHKVSATVHACPNPAYGSVGALPVSKCKYSCSIESRRINSWRTADALMQTETMTMAVICRQLLPDGYHHHHCLQANPPSIFSSSGDVNEHTGKSSANNPRSFASVAVFAHSLNARAVPPRQPELLQPHNPKHILIQSAERSRCYIHPEKVARAIYSSIFPKKVHIEDPGHHRWRQGHQIWGNKSWQPSSMTGSQSLSCRRGLLNAGFCLTITLTYIFGIYTVWCIYPS